MQWTNVKLVQDRIRSSEDTKSYQGISLSNCDSTVQQSLVGHALNVNSLDDKMRERLEWSVAVGSLLAFIETQNWAARFDARSNGSGEENNSEDCSMDEAVEFLTSHFRIPLELH